MMKKVLQLILAITTSLPGFSSEAAPIGASALYRDTFARCSATGRGGQLQSEVRAIWKSFSFQTTRDGFSQGLQVIGLNPMAIAGVIQNHGLTERTNETLNSPDFYQALNDCYGGNIALKRAFITGLISSDVAGKVAAAGVAVAAGWVTVKVVGVATAAYPMLRYGLMAVSATSASYLAYRAIHEALRSATPEERARAKKIVAGPLANSASLVSKTELLLRDEIRNDRAQLSSTQGDEHARLQRRIIVLSSYLDQLQASDKSPIT